MRKRRTAGRIDGTKKFIKATKQTSSIYQTEKVFFLNNNNKTTTTRNKQKTWKYSDNDSKQIRGIAMSKQRSYSHLFENRKDVTTIIINGSAVPGKHVDHVEHKWQAYVSKNQRPPSHIHTHTHTHTYTHTHTHTHTHIHTHTHTHTHELPVRNTPT